MRHHTTSHMQEAGLGPDHLQDVRVGENKLPSVKIWADKYMDPHDFPRKATISKFSMMKSGVKIAEDQHLVKDNSTQYVYIQGAPLRDVPDSEFAPFTTKGDSGSVAWDKDGRLQ